MIAGLKFAVAQSPLVQAARDRIAGLVPKRSYAQHGEDRFVLDHVFAGKRDGVYLDIGASHPVRISNTWLLYRHGWRGVTVEPIKRLSEQHRRLRARDVQVRALMADAPGELDFWSMYPSVLSTCVEAHHRQCLAAGGRLVEKLRLPTVTVAGLIAAHPMLERIDFVSVDIEGFDRLVAAQIAALDEAALPRCVCIECFGEGDGAAIGAILSPRYAQVAPLGPNLIFWNDASGGATSSRR